MTNEIFMTKRGFEDVQSKLNYLTLVGRSALTQRLNALNINQREDIDFKFNAAKDDQSILEGKILDLKQIIARAVIIKPEFTGYVQLGSTVRVQQSGNVSEVFTIVGSVESNPRN